VHLEADECEGEEAAQQKVGATEKSLKGTIWLALIRSEETLPGKDGEGQAAQEDEFGTQENSEEAEGNQGKIL
jgi:hypothetical protein